MRDLERLERYVRSAGAPCVAIFDIGTKASRLLVAPKTVPAAPWQPDTFFNDGDVSELGDDVGKYNKVLPVGESEALQRVVRFMRDRRAALVRLGFAEQDILAVGTYVFRWLENQAEVLAHIREQTGQTLRVINDRYEGRLSLAGLCLAHRCRPGGPEIGRDDRILLLDQGGGSMEVSYADPVGLAGDVHSFNALGTVALRHKFFTTGPSGDRVDPTENRATIRVQARRIDEFIQGAIDGWKGYPALEGRKLHAYALGSAMTNCYPKVNNYKIHNRECTAAMMEDILERTCSKFETTKQQVLTVYKALKGLGGKGTPGWEDVENQLLTLYGLPVYLKILKRFGLAEVRVCGYGLRYGYYAWKVAFGLPDEVDAAPAG